MFMERKKLNHAIGILVAMRKKTAKIFCAIVLLQAFAGCEREKMELTGLSHAIHYLSVLENLNCLPAKIKLAGLKDDYNLDDLWEDSKIEGTWKLLADVSTGDTIDYSCKSVTYTFHSNGTVTIKSNVEEIPGGEFEYNYYSDPYCFLCLPLYPRPNLVIGESENYCQVLRSWLTTFSVIWKLNQGDTVPGKGRGEVERIYYKIN
jgi:hypothetical protein